jgi:hypothetical protein
LFFFTGSQAADSTSPTSRTLSPNQAFNTIIGTQTITPRYQFTGQTRLVETAEGIRDMGSNILKIALDPSFSKQYKIPENPKIQNLTDLVSREPSFRHVFDMPFATYILWTYPFAWCNWKDGLSESERRSQYDEIYAFACHLFKAYNGTRKRFLLGHWEGDWWLLGHSDPKKDPSPEAIQGMIEWYNVRQEALDAARRDTPNHDVEVYQYAEVNLGQKSLDGGITVANNILPHTRVDYVSYSCYDALNFGLEGNAVLPLSRPSSTIWSRAFRRNRVSPGNGCSSASSVSLSRRARPRSSRRNAPVTPCAPQSNGAVPMSSTGSTTATKRKKAAPTRAGSGWWTTRASRNPSENFIRSTTGRRVS